MPADLADQLRVSRELLFAAIELLNKKGYSIEFHPYFGFRLIDLPKKYLPEEITDDLNTRLVGHKIQTFRSVGSTSDMAWELAEKGADDGVVVLADEQIRARARMGNTWFSPADKGIYLAMLLRPAAETPTAELLAHYNIAAALAVAHTLHDIVHVGALIRWPNDIMVGGRKIGNVVTETRPEVPGAVVVSVNLNSALSAGDFPDDIRDRATSIQIETASTINPNRLVRYLLFFFDGLYQKLKRRRTRPVTLGLKQFSLFGNQEVLATDTAGEHRGTVKDLDSHFLTLARAAADGKDYTISHTEIRTVRIIN